MIRLSIRRKIMAIAVTLIALMAITAVMTVVLVMQVGARIEELTYSYMPAYGDLARANIRSLERALSIRRIIIEKLRSPADNGLYTALRNRYDALGGQIELEILAARALVHALIEKGPTFGDTATLSQFESRIDAINDDSRRHLNAENSACWRCSTPATPKHSLRKWHASTNFVTNSIASWKACERIC